MEDKINLNKYFILREMTLKMSGQKIALTLIKRSYTSSSYFINSMEISFSGCQIWFYVLEIKLLEHLGHICNWAVFSRFWLTHGRFINWRANCVCYRSHAVYNTNIGNILSWQDTWAHCCNDWKNGKFCYQEHYLQWKIIFLTVLI